MNNLFFKLLAGSIACVWLGWIIGNFWPLYPHAAKQPQHIYKVLLRDRYGENTRLLKCSRLSVGSYGETRCTIVLSPSISVSNDSPSIGFDIKDVVRIDEANLVEATDNAQKD